MSAAGCIETRHTSRDDAKERYCGPDFRVSRWARRVLLCRASVGARLSTRARDPDTHGGKAIGVWFHDEC